MTTRSPFVLTITTLAVLFAACSSPEAEGATEVRPFSEVQETEFIFEGDPTNPDRGIFRVTTTEPMICAIVWGETEKLGNFNNSLDMNGTGIIDHNVFLPDADPGTEYHFKVQGMTADGTFYESEMGTFVIPDAGSAGDGAGDAIDRGPNLALRGTITEFSSEFSDAFGAVNAIDGDDTTEWATAGSGDDAFITIDLGSETVISGVEFVTRSMADGSAITEEYTVSISGETYGPFLAGNLANPRFAELEANGREVRFDVVSSTGGNTGAVEIKVYGSDLG